MTETWELVRTDRPPAMGEMRFMRRLIPNPAEPLAQLFPVFYRVIWNGAAWIDSEEWSCGHTAGAMCAECYRELAARAHKLAETLQDLESDGKYGMGCN